MTIKMRLDTEGLRALIAENPELEIEIGREVMNNIKDDVLYKGITERINTVLSAMVVSRGMYHNRQYEIRDQNFLDAVGAVVKSVVESKTEALLAMEIQSQVAANMTRIRQDLKSEVRGMITQAITPEVAREVLLAALK